MTRKHFQSLALALSYGQPNPADTPRYEQWLLDVDMVASACAEHNPRFDRARFIEACTQEPKK